MRALLGKIAIHKAVGLYLGEHKVVVVKVASTPLGPLVVASSSESYTADTLAEVTRRLLSPLVGRKGRVPVAVGLANSRVFFGTRLTPTSGDSRPEVELQKALCSSNLSANDLVVDLLRGTVNKQRVARMAACRSKYISNVVAMLDRLGVRPFRTEPGPCALIRLAAQQYRTPRRSKNVLRVFLGAGQGLAVVVVGGMPLSWRAFPLPAGMETFAILSAARGLTTQQRHYGIETPLSHAMIHGRVDLHDRLQQEQLSSELQTRVLWHDGPAWDESAVAYGLALGCQSQDIEAFDLSRSLKTRAPITEIFPWAESVFAAGLVGGMAVVLAMHAMRLDESYVVARAENGQHICLAGAEMGQLEKDKKALEEKVQAVRTFVDTRIMWTNYVHDIAARLPPKAVISVFDGSNPLPGGGKAKKSVGALQLRGTAPLAKNGSIPAEIDAFLRAISKDPLWKRDFASVVTDIKLPLAGKKQESTEVNFSITGVRKSGGTGKGGKSAKPKKEAK